LARVFAAAALSSAVFGSGCVAEPGDVAAREDAAIYGEDDRREWFAFPDEAIRERARGAAVALVPFSSIQGSGDAVTLVGPSLSETVGLCPGPSNQDDARYAATVLAHVIGDSDGSRMYWKLIDPGLADEAEMSHYGFDRTGSYMFYASCDPSKATRVESIMHEVMDNAAAELETEEVERAVSKIAMDMMLRSERPAGRMMALGGQWLYMGEYMPLEEELRRVRAVGVPELRELLERYPLSPRTVVRLTPSPTGA